MALPIARSKKRFTWTLCSACPGDFSNYIIASCNLRTVIIFDRHTGEEVCGNQLSHHLTASFQVLQFAGA